MSNVLWWLYMSENEQKRLQIPLVIDSLSEEEIPASLINEIYEQHEIQDIRFKNRFVCAYCKQTVLLYSRADVQSRHGHLYHFQHTPGTECEWRSDKIGRAYLYQGIKEGNKHRDLKTMLAQTLNHLNGWLVISVDKRFLFSPDQRKRGKPDVYATYKETEVVFEIQLRAESPKIISARQELYRDSGRKLIWLSMENSEIVSEDFSKNCIDVKQVQKDIAFTNRGNWFIFNKNMCQDSIDAGQLVLLAMVWTPEISANKIIYQWRQYKITYNDLTFEKGEVFYKDFHMMHRDAIQQLRQRGQEKCLLILEKEEPRTFVDFIELTRSAWPTFDENHDAEWLRCTFNDYGNNKKIALKAAILDFFKSTDWREKSSHEGWTRITQKISNPKIGININSNLVVIEKILLILGYKISEHLSPEKSKHIWACHNFYDYTSYKPYRELCQKAIEHSKYNNQIVSDKTMQKRINAPVDIEQKHDLDDFLAWFMKDPLLPLES